MVGWGGEGREVTRNLRDTNWLPPNLIDYCGEAGQPGYIGPEQYCYKEWLNNITNVCFSGCQAVFRPSLNDWVLQPTSEYELYKQSSGVYTDENTGQPATYYRKVEITQNSAAPYTVDHPQLTVNATVAWVGGGCPRDFSDPELANSRCRVSVEERLTNWKNY